MNKSNRILSLITSLSLIVVLLAGCGGDDADDRETSDGGAASAGNLSYYQPETVSAPDDAKEILDVQYLAGKLYVACSDALGKLMFYVQDEDGKWNAMGTDYPGYNLSAFYPDGEGGVWLATTDYGDDMEEELEEESFDFDDYQIDYRLIHLAADGSQLLDMDIGGLFEYGYPTALVTDSDGDVYLGTPEGIWILDGGGAVLHTLDSFIYEGGLARTGDGTILAYDLYENQVFVIDKAAGDFGQAYDTGEASLVSGDGEGALYYNTDGLYRLDTTTGDSAEILRWLDSDILAEEVVRCTGLGDDRYLILQQQQLVVGGLLISSGGTDSTLLELKRGEDPNGEKISLRFATLNPDSSLREAVVSYNRQSADYRVVLEDYSQYNTPDDESAGVTKLNTEIISGDIPDLIDLTGLAGEKYVNMGLLADLYPFLDADDSLSRGDLLPNVLEALDEDGKLYQLVTNFSVSTAVGQASRVGGDMGWTFDEFKALADTLEEGEASFAALTNQDFLRLMTQANLDRFLDWDEGTGQFDSQAFRELLEMAAAFPDSLEEQLANNEVMLYQGEALLDYLQIADETTYQIYEALLDGDIVFKGMPTTDGLGGNAIVPISSMAISDTGEHRDGAWSFISYLLSESKQDSLFTGYPLRESSLTKKLESYMQQDGEVSYGISVALSTSDGDLTTISMEPLSAEAIERLTDMVQSTTTLLSTDETLLGIVQEEAEAFFSGDKSADEVSQIIQNRVTTYISEQK